MESTAVRRSSRLGAGALAVFAALVLAAPATAGVGSFRYGVASGEITSKSVLLWAATKKAGKVTAEVATDSKFKKVQKTSSAKAKSVNDNTVQTEVGGLKPETGLLLPVLREEGALQRHGRVHHRAEVLQGG